MTTTTLPTARKVHLASFVSMAGVVSPFCARVPRPIDVSSMSKETWTNRPEAVTCRGCLRRLKQRVSA